VPLPSIGFGQIYRSPTSSVLSARSDSCYPSRLTPFPSLGSTDCRLRFASTDCNHHRSTWTLLDGVPSHFPSRRQQVLPSSCVTPIPVCTCSSDPGRLSGACPSASRNAALTEPIMKAPSSEFRNSIAWLSGSLSMLRAVGRPITTQDSLMTARLSSIMWDFHPPGYIRRFPFTTSCRVLPPSTGLLGARVKSVCIWWCFFFVSYFYARITI